MSLDGTEKNKALPTALMKVSAKKSIDKVCEFGKVQEKKPR